MLHHTLTCYRSVCAPSLSHSPYHNVLLFLQETTSEDEPTSEDEEETSEDVSCCITCVMFVIDCLWYPLIVSHCLVQSSAKLQQTPVTPPQPPPTLPPLVSVLIPFSGLSFIFCTLYTYNLSYFQIQITPPPSPPPVEDPTSPPVNPVTPPLTPPPMEDPAPPVENPTPPPVNPETPRPTNRPTLNVSICGLTTSLVSYTS